PTCGGVGGSCPRLGPRLGTPACTSTKVPFAHAANPLGSKLASMLRMWPIPRLRSDSPGGASITPPPVDQPRSDEPYAPAPAYAASGPGPRPRRLLHARKIPPPVSTPPPTPI